MGKYADLFFYEFIKQLEKAGGFLLYNQDKKDFEYVHFHELPEDRKQELIEDWHDAMGNALETMVSQMIEDKM